VNHWNYGKNNREEFKFLNQEIGVARN
jgi:hypothetical protein